MNEAYHSYQLIRETIIRDQLKKLLPTNDKLDILFCAYDMRRLIDNFKANPNFDGGKC